MIETRQLAVYSSPEREHLENHIGAQLFPGDIIIRDGRKHIVTGTYRRTHQLGPNCPECCVHMTPYDPGTEHIDVPAALTKEEILACIQDEKDAIDAMRPDVNDAENDVTLFIKQDLWKAEVRAISMSLLERLSQKTKESREIMYQDIPDHPIIQNCEATGYPDGKAPVELLCPLCEAACEDVYENQAGDIVGCDRCLTAKPIEDALRQD